MGKKNKNLKVTNEQFSWQIERLRPMIIEKVKSLGYNLELAEFVKESGFNYLQITISHEDRIINHQDCEKVSRAIDENLDSDDKIPFPYSLEVQSPRTDVSLECLTNPSGLTSPSECSSEHEFKVKGLDLVVNI